MELNGVEIKTEFYPKLNGFATVINNAIKSLGEMEARIGCLERDPSRACMDAWFTGDLERGQS